MYDNDQWLKVYAYVQRMAARAYRNDVEAAADIASECFDIFIRLHRDNPGNYHAWVGRSISCLKKNLTDFTIRTGTIFERSKVPLHKWLYAMYLLITARKGISSLQLAKQIGVTQKTAWFMLQRLREACGNDLTTLAGIVECDETYVGGREANRHELKRKGLGRGSIGKTPVLAARERGGRVRAKVVQEATARTVYSFIRHAVDAGAELHTDEAAVYRPLNGLYYRQRSINHGLGEYVRDNVTTNGVESVFAVLKRGLIGVYHHASSKHLGRYVNEFAFRLNDGDVKRHTLDRLSSLFGAAIGRRLTYAELIA